MTAPSTIVAPRLDVPVTSTLVVWAVLLGVALVALLGLAALGRRHNPNSTDNHPRQRRTGMSTMDCARLVAEARELAREAPATAERAQAAAGPLAEAQVRRAEARQRREAAGQAFDEAQRAYDEAMAAWRAHAAERAVPVRSAEADEQDREVSRAALAAYRRGDVSVDELREVFRRTGGWDPAQEQRDQELALLRAEAQRTHRAYDAAVVAERIADKAASVAEVAMQALVEEAAEAAEEARSANTAAQECLRALRRRRRFWRTTGDVDLFSVTPPPGRRPTRTRSREPRPARSASTGRRP